MAGPVGVIADIGHGGNPGQPVVMQASAGYPLNRGALPQDKGVKVQDFFPLGDQIKDMALLARVFLGNLEFQHLVGSRHGPKQG
ncbi:hypothetical protein D3C75_1100450 [compost metagenome]